jgi:hypothetical protein
VNGWPELRRVRELGQVRDQKDYPGIQAADLLAWYTNRALTKSAYRIELALFANRTAPAGCKVFDKDALAAEFCG